MKKCYIVITAQSRPMQDEPALDRDFDDIAGGVIRRICNEMGIEIVKSDSYRKDSRTALIFRGDATGAARNLDEIRHALELAGEKLNLTVRVQKEDLFRYMHRI